MHQYMNLAKGVSQIQLKQTKKTLRKSMCIVAAADNNYAQHLAVAFASILKNNRGQVPEIYVIGDELNTKNKNWLLETVKPFGATIDYRQADPTVFEQARVSGYLTHAAYLRILMAELLPPDIEKAIYIDCDVVVEKPLSELWSIDISKYHIGAVPDMSIEEDEDRGIFLHGKKGLPYFNSGVLLINLRKWREDNTAIAVIEFAKDNPEKMIYGDQDALNAILCRKCLPIDLKWNMQTSMLFQKIKNKTAEDISFRYATEDPHIIHYTGRGKPWRFISTHPFRNNYYRYLKLTPWRWFRPRLTFWDVIDGAGLFIKKTTPSLFKAVRKILVKGASGGSPLCSMICNSFHIGFYR